MKPASASRIAPLSTVSAAGGFAGAWGRGDESARAFWPRHPHRAESWSARIDRATGTPPATTVWARAARTAGRLGADEAAIAGIAALEAGGALCVTTGQQPGLFLGPLYTVWKAMTAVALAARIEADTGRKTVPVFWSGADDSDFGEVARAFFPGEAYRLTRHALEGGDLPAAGMVGDLGTDGTRRELDGLRLDWAERSGGAALIGRLERALERAEDHGELAQTLLYDLFRGTGLVVVDGRWKALRFEAAPLFRRWAARRDEVGDAVVARGAALEAAGFPARISEASARRGLFEIRDGRRLPLEGGERELTTRIERAPETLSPNVTLRSLVQDSLFPNVATVGGPGEIAYHAQLAPAYERLEVDPPMLVPRYEATLVPDGVARLAARRGVSVEELVADFDGTLKRTTDRALPASLRAALEDLERETAGAADRVRSESAAFDPKLEGAAGDAQRRLGDTVRKLHEKISQAARAAEARRDPAVKHYREFLKPRGVPQERVLSGLAFFLDDEGLAGEEFRATLAAHVEDVHSGPTRHWLLAAGGAPDEPDESDEGEGA